MEIAHLVQIKEAVSLYVKPSSHSNDMLYYNCLKSIVLINRRSTYSLFVCLFTNLIVINASIKLQLIECIMNMPLYVLLLKRFSNNISMHLIYYALDLCFGKLTFSRIYIRIFTYYSVKVWILENSSFSLAFQK